MIKNFKFQISNFKFFVFIFLLVTVNCLLLTGIVFAAGGGEHHAATWKDWLWPVINFAILVTVLVYFGRKPAKEFFKKRTELIEKSLKEAEEAKMLAKKALEEVKERLRNTDREISEILEGAKRAGEREKEALIVECDRLKEKIIEQARANIEFELEKAKKEIKSEAALMAIELAEKQIKERLDKKEQEALIDEYIQKLEVKK